MMNNASKPTLSAKATYQMTTITSVVRQFFKFVCASILLSVFGTGCSVLPSKNSEPSTVSSSFTLPGVNTSLRQARKNDGQYEVVNSHIRLAENAYGSGDWRTAAEHYQTVVKILEGDGYSWFRLGNCYSRLDEFDSAINAYEMALRYKSLNTDKVLYNLSTAHLLSAKASLIQAASTRSSEVDQKRILKRLQDVDVALGVLASAHMAQQSVQENDSTEQATQQSVSLLSQFDSRSAK